MSKVNIDEKFLPEQLREWADKLDDNYYLNILEVVESMAFQVSVYNEKIKSIQRYILSKHIEEYGTIKLGKDGTEETPQNRTV